MRLDVVDLHSFYYRTKLGRIVQRALRDRIGRIWPDAKGQTVVGFGFASPLLRPYLKSARRVINLMPGAQGVMHWPDGMPNHSVLTEELKWPLATGSVDLLILLHGLESAERPTRLFEEIWRVLAPGGRAIFIVTNRSGLWARADATPFGFGQPYTLGQLEATLQRNKLVPVQHGVALFSPPSHRGFFIRSSQIWEKLGRRLPARMAAGVVLVEVTKQIHAPTHRGLTEAVRKPLEALEGIAQPVGKPVSGRSADQAEKG